MAFICLSIVVALIAIHYRCQASAERARADEYKRLWSTMLADYENCADENFELRETISRRGRVTSRN